MAETFEIILTEEAQSDLNAIKDGRTYSAIETSIDRLESEPDKRGKQLRGKLSDYWSMRAAGQRYRVLYQIGVLEGVVTVVVVGIRKEGDKRDAYKVANKRLGGKR